MGHGYIHGYDLEKYDAKSALFKFDTHCCSFCRFQTVQTLNHSIFTKPKNEEKITKNEEKNEAFECNQNESLLAKQLKEMNVNKNQNKNENEIICQNKESSQILV